MAATREHIPPSNCRRRGWGRSRVEHCTINGIEGEYYPSSNSGTSNLIWVGTEQGILFAIDSTLEKPVILHIAESVSLTDSTK